MVQYEAKCNFLCVRGFAIFELKCVHFFYIESFHLIKLSSERAGSTIITNAFHTFCSIAKILSSQGSLYLKLCAFRVAYVQTFVRFVLYPDHLFAATILVWKYQVLVWEPGHLPQIHAHTCPCACGMSGWV